MIPVARAKDKIFRFCRSKLYIIYCAPSSCNRGHTSAILRTIAKIFGSELDLDHNGYVGLLVACVLLSSVAVF